MSTRPVALVTGASAGIGKVFAQRLAAAGFDLVLVARDAARLQGVADELSLQYGVAADSIAADLSRDEGIRGVAERIAQMDRLTMLVNNAGFGTRGKLANRPVAEQATMLELHVMAPMLLTRAALTGMIARGEGTIINVASVASYACSMGNVNYCATKAYLRVFSEGLQLELDGTGVHVQALCPGFTHSEFHERGGMDKGAYPKFFWLSADRVVDESLAQAARHGPVVCVPSLRYKFAVFLLKHAPDFLKRWPRRRVARSRV